VSRRERETGGRPIKTADRTRGPQGSSPACVRAGWRSSVEVFVYFNNDWEAFAVRNARRLRQQLT